MPFVSVDIHERFPLKEMSCILKSEYFSFYRTHAQQKIEANGLAAMHRLWRRVFGLNLCNAKLELVQVARCAN